MPDVVSLQIYTQRCAQVETENLRKLGFMKEPEFVFRGIDDVIYFDAIEGSMDKLRNHSFFNQCRANK